MNAQQLRKRIYDAIPEGTVIPQHDQEGHKYFIVPLGEQFLSVTTKLAVIKYPSIQNWKMNKALDYVSRNWRSIDEHTIMDIIDAAAKAPVEEFEGAGSVGTEIHECRERYFKEWIRLGARPQSTLDFIPADQRDTRIVSAMRALESFCIKENYEPIATELYVYSAKLKIAGTLDDIGLLPFKTSSGRTGKRLVLMDIKTSNQAIKISYAYQVALYYGMFKRLTGLIPKKSFILHLSKQDGTYKIPEIRQISKVFKAACNVLKVYDSEEFVKKMIEKPALII